MAKYFLNQGGENFEIPELNQALEEPIVLSDPRIGAMETGPSSTVNPPGARSSNKALGCVVVGALVLGGIVALGAVGFFMLQGPPQESGEEYFGPSEPVEFPSEITDLDALAAVPGVTFESTFDNIIVGEDIASGVYIAPDAAPASAEDAMYCHWSVTPDGSFAVDGFNAMGRVEEGTAMLLAPDGYVLSVSPSCGTWEAVDPATVFDSGSGTVIGSEIHTVGYDVMPGLYLSNSQVAEGAGCFVTVTDNFGFTGPGTESEFLYGAGGTVRFTVEAGDFVEARGCPDFEWADPATAFADEGAATSIDVGVWIVGVDVAAGTYMGPGEAGAGNYCSAYVWEGVRDWVDSEPLESVWYSPGEPPETVTLEPGQTMHIAECDGWQLVQP